MGFLGGIINSVKRKSAELKERREFLDMVESKAKPIRRESYMKQMLKEVVQEGIEKAKDDAKKRKPQKTKTESDFGMKGIEDPYKFINPKGGKKNGNF